MMISIDVDANPTNTPGSVVFTLNFQSILDELVPAYEQSQGKAENLSAGVDVAGNGNIRICLYRES